MAGTKQIKDAALIEALMNEPTVKAAAERCGCSRSTVYARLNDHKFSELLTESIAERRRVTNALAAHALELASETMLELLTAPGVSDDIRLKAATAVFRSFA